MKEAILLQNLADLITQNKYGDGSIEAFNIEKTPDNKLKVTVVFDIEKVHIPPKGLKVATPENKQSKNPPIAEEVVVQLQEKEEKKDAFPSNLLNLPPTPNAKRIIAAYESRKAEKEESKTEVKSIKDIPTITADENGNITVGNKKDSDKEKSKSSVLSGGKSLYKEHYFTNDEVTYITAYLNDEITGGEGYILLGLKKPSDFYNLVQKYKRSKNITTTKKEFTSKVQKENSVESKTSGTQKISDADLEYIYTEVRRGDTMSNFCKEFGIAPSTLTDKMHKYIKKHGLEPLFVNGKRRTSITTKSTSKAEKVTVPAGTADGWQLASDGKFHMVKKETVVE